MQRSLVFVPTSGLGNSILALASTAVVAHAACRRLVLAWDSQTARAMGARFEELFQPRPGFRVATHRQLAGVPLACHMLHTQYGAATVAQLVFNSSFRLGVATNRLRQAQAVGAGGIGECEPSVLVSANHHLLPHWRRNQWLSRSVEVLGRAGSCVPRATAPTPEDSR